MCFSLFLVETEMCLCIFLEEIASNCIHAYYWKRLHCIKFISGTEIAVYIPMHLYTAMPSSSSRV